MVGSEARSILDHRWASREKALLWVTAQNAIAPRASVRIPHPSTFAAEPSRGLAGWFPQAELPMIWRLAYDVNVNHSSKEEGIWL